MEKLQEEARTYKITDEEMEEPRVSFIYGNAPQGSTRTKEAVRAAAKRMRLFPD